MTAPLELMNRTCQECLHMTTSKHALLFCRLHDDHYAEQQQECLDFEQHDEQEEQSSFECD